MTPKFDAKGLSLVQVALSGVMAALVAVATFFVQIPNPATNKREKNLVQAKFIIDTIDMLKDKTKNNLNNDENKLLEDILYELRMQYVSADKSSEATT